MDNRSIRTAIKKSLAIAATLALGPQPMPGAEGPTKTGRATEVRRGPSGGKWAVKAEIRAAAKLRHVRALASKRKPGHKGRWRRRKQHQVQRLRKRLHAAGAFT